MGVGKERDIGTDVDQKNKRREEKFKRECREGGDKRRGRRAGEKW